MASSKNPRHFQSKEFSRDTAEPSHSEPTFFSSLCKTVSGWMGSQRVQLPGLEKVQRHSAQMELVKNAAAQGRLSLDEALKLAELIAISATVLKVTELSDRLELLETTMEELDAK